MQSYVFFAVSNVMLKSALLICALLMASTCLMAQTDCSQTVSGSDAGCTTNSCTSIVGCTAYNFTAACTGTYYIDAWTKCSPGDCGDCRSCVNLYESGQINPLTNCHTAWCDSSDCDQTCGYALVADTDYIMYVCLVPCPDSDCHDCDDDCTAGGCVRYAQTAPCW